MSDAAPAFHLDNARSDTLLLTISGNWGQDVDTPAFSDLLTNLNVLSPTTITVRFDNIEQWDSVLMAFLLQ